MNILIVDDEATALRDLSRVMRKTVPECSWTFRCRTWTAWLWLKK